MRIRMLTTGNLQSDLQAVAEPVVEVLHGSAKIIPICTISHSFWERSSTSPLALKPIGLIIHHIIIPRVCQCQLPKGEIYGNALNQHRSYLKTLSSGASDSTPLRILWFAGLGD